MEIFKFLNKKLIVVNIAKLAFVFLLPLQFDISIGTEGTGYGISSQSYIFLTGILSSSYTRFRWIIVQYPISLILALVALIFTTRLHQLRGKSYPIRSAFVVGLVLSVIPIYYFIQFFLVSNLYWFDIMATAPVSIGFCSSLFLIFVILPSISWYSDSVSADRSIPKKKDDQEDGEKKRTTFTPKMSSYLMFLAAFLLPGMIMFQSFTSNQNISFIGLLLQFSFGFSTDFSQLGLAYTLQDIIFWDLFGVSIVCCAASLVFAWTIMRYVHGKGTKRIAILVGFLSEIPPILYTINGLAYGLAYVSVWLILPLPIVLIIGLLVLRFTTAIEPIRKSTELDQSVIKVPLKFRMKSHLFGQHKRSDETPLESRDAGDEEAQ